MVLADIKHKPMATLASLMVKKDKLERQRWNYKQ